MSIQSYSLFIKKNHVKSNGKTPIYIRYYASRNSRVLINTGEEINPNDWLISKSQPKAKLSNVTVINSLNFQLNRLSNILQYTSDVNVEPTTAYIKRLFQSNENFDVISSEMDFYGHLEHYINAKRDQVVPDVIKDYYAMKKHLKGFEVHRETPITFESLNYDFYLSWIDYLAVHPQNTVEGPKGLSNNSIGKQVKNLKAFLNDRMRRKLISPIDISQYKVIQEEVDHVYLNQSEIDDIAKVDVEGDEDLKKIKDFFIIGCYTGLRFSDIVRLKPEYISEGMITLRQKKTSGKVVVPLRKPVQEVLKRNNNFAPQVSSFEFNKNIKVLGRKAGIDEVVEIEKKKGIKKVVSQHKKYDLISSHTCRRSFCTNAYLEGIDVQLIMKISGHKTEKAFKRYLKLSSLEAALKLKEAWGI